MAKQNVYYTKHDSLLNLINRATAIANSKKEAQNKAKNKIYDNHSSTAKAAQAANWKAMGSTINKSSSSGSSGKSYTTSSGSSSGGGGNSSKTTQKTETYYERTTTTQQTVETTTITYKITKDDKTTLDNGATITDIRLYDNSPDNKFMPQTEGIGLDDLFSKCTWDTTKPAESKGAALTKNYTEAEFKAAIINSDTPTDGSKKTGNNIGESGADLGRIVLNKNSFSYIFGSHNDAYIYDPNTNSYVKNTNPRDPNIKYTKKDDSCEVTLTYYEDIIRPETNSEWLGRVKNNERPSFAQIYKKLKDDDVINSISISTTSKFRDYMSQVWGTPDGDNNIVPLDLDKEAKNGDAKHVLTLFIDNITLHEAKHIPLFYPNVRMKFYHSNNKPDDVDTYNLRKMGAVIEYR